MHNLEAIMPIPIRKMTAFRADFLIYTLIGIITYQKRLLVLRLSNVVGKRMDKKFKAMNMNKIDGIT